VCACTWPSLKYLYYKHESLASKVAADRAYFEKWGSIIHPACTPGCDKQDPESR
jgi:hypothetical protein